MKVNVVILDSTEISAYNFFFKWQNPIVLEYQVVN